MASNNNKSESGTLIATGNDIQSVSIEKELKGAYLEYAMSVIVSRAIPDVRDGLKPVHRRILYAMYENGFMHNRPHKKSARVVGEVISKYHPHGDVAIYDALVRMAQDFSMGTMLVDGQGNFGSIDDDPPAAMRYTEVKLRKITQTMMADIDKETVDWRENYDGSEMEPTVLPASFPNIVVNGSEGIAVGMATNIPPHNLGEVIDACLLYINNPHVTMAEMLEVIPGPDFPTHGIMIGSTSIRNAMMAGRGSVIIRGRAHFEEMKANREAIVITEIPYHVVKSRLVEKIAGLVKEKKIEGISNIRDESNKDGIRVVIEVKRDASADVVLNHLYKFTPLQSSFALNMLALKDNKPELMNTTTMIKVFVDFRVQVVTRRIACELRRTRARAHVMIGLRVAVDSIDHIISIIRSSTDSADAKEKLLNRDWPVDESVTKLITLVGDQKNHITDNKFRFTEEQVKSILEMRLSRLTGLERQKIISELEELGTQIAYCLSVLRDKEKLMGIISSELQAIKDEFAVPRRTIIENISSETEIEDLIEKEQVLVTVTRNGYIKRNSLSNYTSQHRGGKGKMGINMNEDDDILDVLVSNTHAQILLFSNKGKVYKIKTYAIPVASNQAKGRALVNFIPLDKGETINNFLTMPEDKKVWNQFDLVFATANGNVRRSNISDFESINSNGKIAIRLDLDDSLIGVKLAHESANVLLATQKGMSVRFEMGDLRVIKSRNSDGVRGINLAKEDKVVAMCILNNNENDATIKDKYTSIPLADRLAIKEMTEEEVKEKYKSKELELPIEKIIEMSKSEQFILTINENGFGKRTSSYEYRITNRGGKGIINIDISRGDVLSTFLANKDDDIILIGNRGKVLRCSAGDISIIGRNTKGVKIVNLSDEKIASVTKIENIDTISEEYNEQNNIDTTESGSKPTVNKQKANESEDKTISNSSSQSNNNNKEDSKESSKDEPEDENNGSLF